MSGISLRERAGAREGNGQIGAEPTGARGEGQHAVGKKDGFGDRVCDHDHGFAIAIPDAEEFERHALTGDGVERAERFVKQQHVGAVDKSAGDGDALFHAAGEIARARVVESGQADEFDQIVGAAQGFVFGNVLQFERQGDVLQDGAPRHEVGFLKHQPDAAARMR